MGKLVIGQTHSWPYLSLGELVDGENKVGQNILFPILHLFITSRFLCGRTLTAYVLCLGDIHDNCQQKMVLSFQIPTTAAFDP